MARYHISKDGSPGVCSASKRECPIGEDTPHGEFESEKEARAWVEKVLENQSGGSLQSKKKVSITEEMPRSPRAAAKIKKLNEYGFKTSDLIPGARYGVVGSWRGDTYVLGTETNIENHRTMITMDGQGTVIGTENNGSLTGQQFSGAVLGSIIDWVEKKAGPDQDPWDRISDLSIVKLD